MIDFPASPTIGQQFTAAGVTWTWDGVKWAASGLSVAYLQTAGGTMLGPIVLAADLAAALQPVTKQYFDARPMIGDNRIINGDMRIDQRNNGAGGTAQGYTVDRWQYSSSLTTKGTWGRSIGANPGPPGFPYYLAFVSNSSYSALAGDYFQFAQAMEGDAVSDFAWGTANAQLVTLSFWANSNVTGVFSGSVSNYAGTRSYPFNYSLPTTAWTKVSVTIPGDTAGAWVMGGNAGALVVHFDLGAGSNARGPANAWANANYIGVTGAVSILATNSGQLNLTGVKLEIGSVATLYNRQTMAKSMADCQRYYQTLKVLATSPNAIGGAVFYNALTLPVMMRANPTANNAGSGFTNCSTPTVSMFLTPSACYIGATAAANGAASYTANITFDAEL